MADEREKPPVIDRHLPHALAEARRIAPPSFRRLEDELKKMPVEAQRAFADLMYAVERDMLQAERKGNRDAWMRGRFR